MWKCKACGTGIEVRTDQCPACQVLFPIPQKIPLAAYPLIIFVAAVVALVVWATLQVVRSSTDEALSWVPTNAAFAQTGAQIANPDECKAAVEKVIAKYDEVERYANSGAATGVELKARIDATRSAVSSAETWCDDVPPAKEANRNMRANLDRLERRMNDLYRQESERR